MLVGRSHKLTLTYNGIEMLHTATDAPFIKVMELKLNVSTQGLATSDLATNQVQRHTSLARLFTLLQVISLDEMAKISFAAGGEHEDYDFICYIAKDKRDNRCENPGSIDVS